MVVVVVVALVLL